MRIIKSKKYKTKLNISLKSSDSDSASLSFINKQNFLISKKKVESAKENISVACKNYTLEIDRYTFTITLNKIFENDELISEAEKVDVYSDEFTAEAINLMDLFSENGASRNPIRLFFSKIANKFSHLTKSKKTDESKSDQEASAETEESDKDEE